MSSANSPARRFGFSLVELMVVVSVIGIVSMVAIPSYVQYTVRANRASAQSYLLNLANRETQYMLDARSYTNSLATLLAVPADVAANYTVTITVNNSATPPTYTITATPINAQLSNDKACAVLTINYLSTRTISGTGTVKDCWGGR